MKKLLSVILSFSLVIALCTSLPSASVSADSEGDWQYTVSNGEATIAGYTGSASSVTIPSTLGGYPVTSIGGGAFYKCTSLTSITIPDSVTSIGGSAFSNCTNLTSITIGEGVTSIGGGAFYKCTSLTSIEIPDSVTGIGNYAFCECKNLSSVTIGNSVTSIGYSPFSGCTSLTSITIPDSVTSIGGYAFSGCNGLTSVTIGDGVTSIGGGAFSGCTSLTSITIPDSVASIGDGAFYNTAWYDNQPDGLVYAGKVAYKYKGSMPSNTSITLKEGTKGIADRAFSYCTNLTSITIPDSVTSIEEGAFSGCSGLTEMTIPFVGDRIHEPADTYQYPFGYIFGTSSYTGSTGTIQYYYGSSTGSTTSSTYYIPSSLRSVTVTGGNLPYGAFDGCRNLTSVTIESGVTSIGSDAFYCCTNLTSITIPDSVTSIGDLAFYGCTSLETATILGSPEFGVRVFPNSAILRGYEGSSVEAYANANNLAFESLGHTGGTATCIAKAVCERCHEEYGDLNPNNHVDCTDKPWQSNDEQHWKVCGCGELILVGEHTPSCANCDICGKRSITISAASVVATSNAATITVPICVTGVRDSDDIGAMDIQIGYDASKLRITKYYDVTGSGKNKVYYGATAFDSHQTSPISEVVNPFHVIVWTASEQNLNLDTEYEINDQEFCFLEFEAIGNWAGSTPLTVSGRVQRRSDDELLDVVFENGSISLGKIGDVDGNGELDIADITLLAKFVAGWNVGDIIRLESADCYEDGEIDISDITLLAKKVAGWAVVFGPQA